MDFILFCTAMPTNENASTPVASSATQSTQTTGMFQSLDQDFNLAPEASAIVSQNVSDTPEASTTDLFTPVADEFSTTDSDGNFDFSLDLPGNYSDAEVTPSPMPQMTDGDASQQGEQSSQTSMEELLSDEPVQASYQSPTDEPLPQAPLISEGPFVNTEDVETEIDPFEAMRASLQSSTLEDKAPVAESPESKETQESVLLDAPHTQVPVEQGEVATPIDSVNNVEAHKSLDTFDNGGIEAGGQDSSEVFKTTENPDSFSPTTPVAEKLDPSIEATASEVPSMLSLDEMIEAPILASGEQRPLTPEVQPATVNLDQLTAMDGMTQPKSPSNPLSAPVNYPSVVGGNVASIQVPSNNPAPISNASSSKQNLFVLAGMGVLLVLGTVMMFMKYPTFFQELLDDTSHTSSTTEHTSTEEEHPAPPVLSDENSDSPDPVVDVGTGIDASDLVEVEPEESDLDLSGKVQVITLEPSEVDSNMQSLSTEETPSVAEESPKDISHISVTDQISQQSASSSSNWSVPADPLTSVEDLVGPIDNMDTIAQQIESYRLQVQNIVDTGRAQGVKSMVKWGVYVVNQVEQIQEKLANGEKMTISEWNARKAELDIFLAKATNA